MLVTGSSRGIGRAIALQLARDGYDLVLHCRSQVEQAHLVESEIRALGRQARVLQFDVSMREKSAEMLLADVEQHGCYYGVVCNAGITRDNAFPAMPGEDWDAVIYNVLQPLVMPLVRRRKPGRIVTLSSVSGVMGNRGQVNYSAAKAGIIGASKALAVELASRQITVNCVAPGLIETELVDEALLSKALDTIPMRRIGTASEVASVVSFLLSEGAAYVTRQVISVNGGLA